MESFFKNLSSHMILILRYVRCIAQSYRQELILTEGLDGTTSKQGNV